MALRWGLAALLCAGLARLEATALAAGAKTSTKDDAGVFEDAAAASAAEEDQEYDAPPLPPPANGAPMGAQQDEEQEDPGPGYEQAAGPAYGQPQEAPGDDAPEIQAQPPLEPGPAEQRPTGAMMQRAAEAAAIRNMHHQHQVMKQFMNRFSKNLRFAVLEDSQGDLPEAERLAMMKKLRQEGATGETPDAARADAAVLAAAKRQSQQRRQPHMPMPRPGLAAQRRGPPLHARRQQQQQQQQRMQASVALRTPLRRQAANLAVAAPRAVAPRNPQHGRHRARMLNGHRGPARRAMTGAAHRQMYVKEFANQEYPPEGINDAPGVDPERLALASRRGSTGGAAASAYGEDGTGEEALPPAAEDAPVADSDPELQQAAGQDPEELEDAGPADPAADSQALTGTATSDSQQVQPMGGAAEGDDPIVVDALGRSIPLVLGNVKHDKNSGQELPVGSGTWMYILIAMAAIAAIGLGGGYFYMHR